MNKELLRLLPKVDEVMLKGELKEYIDSLSYEQVKKTVQEEIEELRTSILNGTDYEAGEEQIADIIYSMIINRLKQAERRNLRPVVNATGVVLHTNLGRANLSEDAIDQVNSVMGSYSTLEYNPEEGKRGSRHDHVEGILCNLTGAEAAMVVNNNAAATMLVLSAMGRGKEVIVSRGELVEIGGSFRIPDIMEESGAKLIEVGTTNKTRLKDYKRKINDNTAALLKVHTSNYKIIGFTEEVSVKELKELGDKYNLPVIYDMGSGLMVDLSEAGIKEPVVRDGLNQGADVILFSGDKLLGGPQAGIILGKKELIDKMKTHPLARVLRVDKLTLSALEATLLSYYKPDKVKTEIPVLRMITMTEDELEKKCEELKGIIESKALSVETKIIHSEGPVGGGSAPGARLKNVAVGIRHESISASVIEKKLLSGEMPIVARIHDDWVIFEARTLEEKDYDVIASRIKEITRA